MIFLRNYITKPILNIKHEIIIIMIIIKERRKIIIVIIMK